MVRVRMRVRIGVRVGVRVRVEIGRVPVRVQVRVWVTLTKNAVAHTLMTNHTVTRWALVVSGSSDAGAPGEVEGSSPSTSL